MGFWFKPNYNNYGYSRLVSWAAYSGTYGGFELEYSFAPKPILAMIFYDNTGNAGVFSLSGNAFNWNSWNFCAVTWTSTGASIYINNGTSQTYNGSTPWTAPTGVTFTIGAQTNNNSPYKGSISNFVYADNVQWNAATITAFYQGKIPPNPTVYLPLNEGSQSTAYDISGNGNNGTITSGTFTSDVPFKKRKLVNDNLVYNGDFEYAPPTNVATTAGNSWIDGTTGASTTNPLFGWRAELSAGSMSSQFDNSTSHSGNWSLKCSTTAINSRAEIWSTYTSSVSLLQYAIPLKSGTTYQLSGWLKTQINSGSATTGAYFFVNTYSGTGTYINTPTTTTHINTTTNWTYYQTSFTANANQNLAIVGMAINGTDGAGTLIMDAWFDDIVLVPTITPTRTLIV